MDRYVKVGTIYTKLSRYDDDGGIAADRPQDIPVLAPFALPEDSPEIIGLNTHSILDGTKKSVYISKSTSYRIR